MNPIVYKFVYKTAYRDVAGPLIDLATCYCTVVSAILGSSRVCLCMWPYGKTAVQMLENSYKFTEKLQCKEIFLKKKKKKQGNFRAYNGFFTT